MTDPTLRSLPFSNDAEKGVLSSILHAPEKILADARNTIPAEAFYHPANRLLYETLCELSDDERPIEYIAVSQYLTDTNRIDKIGGQGALAEILDFIPTPTHYAYYKGIMVDRYRHRQILRACQDSIDDVYANPEQGPELLERVVDRFYQLSKQQDTKGAKTFREILDGYMDVWHGRLEGKIETGIPTRWQSWNRTFGGLTPRMWLITAYPSEGKSALLQNLVEDTIAHGRNALWFSFEMDEIELFDRLVTAKSRVDSQRIFFPQNGCDRREMAAISKALGDMTEWGLHLRCESSWTFEQVMAEARAVAMKTDLGMIGVDYLQLMSSGKKFSTRAEEVAYMSRSMKRLSRNLGIPVVVLSQLTDEGKTLESRAPGQDASNAVYIQTRKSVTERGKTTVTPGGIVATKNRNGKRGDLLPITLNGATFTFEEPASEGPDLPLAGKPADWQ